MNNYNYPANSTKSEDLAKAIWMIQKQSAEKYGFPINLITDKILELGPGNGVHLNYLQQQGAKNIKGVDAYLKHKDEFPDLNIAEADISNMPFESNQFDILLSTSVFDSRLYEEQNRIDMLKDIHRVLKPNGLYLGHEYWEANQLQAILQQVPHRAHSIIIGMNYTYHIPAQN